MAGEYYPEGANMASMERNPSIFDVAEKRASDYLTTTAVGDIPEALGRQQEYLERLHQCLGILESRLTPIVLQDCEIKYGGEPDCPPTSAMAGQLRSHNVLLSAAVERVQSLTNRLTV